jgi:Cap4 SAVED domain
VTAPRHPSQPAARAPKKLLAAASPVSVDDLDFDVTAAVPWFPHGQETPYILIRVADAHAKAWAATLGVAVRRCYVTDGLLAERAKVSGASKADVLATVLPDPGSTMAGDFGEILVYFYQAAHALPSKVFGAKKWRLKQDRTKPAPGSDVLQFILPSWPQASNADVLFCSEVKLKSGAGTSRPISEAIRDSAKDRTSRLAKTLVWLRERAVSHGLGDVKVEHLDRFIKAIDHPPPTKRFRAVAVVCASLVDAELAADAPKQPPSEYSVVVISVPQLKKIYSSVFDAARRSVPVQAAGPGKAR